MLKVERLKRFGVAWPQETQQDIRENGNEHSPTMNLLKNNLNTKCILWIVNFHIAEGLLLRCWYDWLISWLLISRSSGNIVHGENKFTNKVKCDTGNDLQTDVLITTRWSMVYRIWTYFSCKGQRPLINKLVLNRDCCKLCLTCTAHGFFHSRKKKTRIRQ